MPALSRIDYTTGMTAPSTNRRPTGVWAAIVIGVPVMLYLLGFLLLLLDALFLEGELWHQMPSGVHAALETIYTPLIWLVNQFFG